MNQYSGGSGLEDDPYKISTPDDVKDISESPASNFIIVNDIDMKGHNVEIDTFSGVLDGQNNTIRCLNLEYPDKENVGLVNINKGIIQNIKFEDCNVSGFKNVGLVSGFNKSSGEINNCKISNTTVEGIVKVGGVAGTNNNYIKDCCVSATVRKRLEVSSKTESCHMVGYLFGGVVGYSNYHGERDEESITDCESRCFVFARIGVGGICGKSRGGVIKNSSSECWIKGISQLGGIIGELIDNDVEACSSKSYIYGTKVCGGIVGYNCGKVHIVKSFSEVKGEKSIGGVVGQNGLEGEVRVCYYAMDSISEKQDEGKSVIVGDNGKDCIVSNCFWIGKPLYKGVGTNSGELERLKSVKDVESLESNLASCLI